MNLYHVTWSTLIIEGSDSGEYQAKPVEEAVDSCQSDWESGERGWLNLVVQHVCTATACCSLIVGAYSAWRFLGYITL